MLKSLLVLQKPPFFLDPSGLFWGARPGGTTWTAPAGPCCAAWGLGATDTPFPAPWQGPELPQGALWRRVLPCTVSKRRSVGARRGLCLFQPRTESGTPAAVSSVDSRWPPGRLEGSGPTGSGSLLLRRPPRALAQRCRRLLGSADSARLMLTALWSRLCSSTCSQVPALPRAQELRASWSFGTTGRDKKQREVGDTPTL